MDILAATIRKELVLHAGRMINPAGFHLESEMSFPIE